MNGRVLIRFPFFSTILTTLAMPPKSATNVENPEKIGKKVTPPNIGIGIILGIFALLFFGNVATTHFFTNFVKFFSPFTFLNSQHPTYVSPSQLWSLTKTQLFFCGHYFYGGNALDYNQTNVQKLMKDTFKQIIQPLTKIS